MSGCEISEAYQSQVSIPAANPSVLTLGGQASHDGYNGGERPVQGSRVIDDAPPQSNVSRRGAGGIKASEQMSQVQNDSQLQQMHQLMQNSSQAGQFQQYESRVSMKGPFYRQVTIEAAQKFANEENLLWIGETSCQQNMNCAELFDLLV